MEIRYLEQEEKERSRKLWERCFPEDSARFLDYYYNEKCRDNRILVLEDGKKEDGQKEDKEETEICAMLQRNPYPVRWGGAVRELDYIVAVATAPERRHQGCMRRLLMRMLEDQNREEMPFTFLMPADPAIYRPFGFVYVYDQPFWRLNEAGKGLRRVRIRADVSGAGRNFGPEPDSTRNFGQEPDPARNKGLEEQLKEAEEWLNRWLEERYQVFVRRDHRYLLRLWKEIRSEYGQWELLYDGERLVGMECFWGKEKKERRFLYAEEEFTEPDQKARPAIMARIVNLEAFMKGIRLKPKGVLERELQVTLGICDGQIKANNGLFSWRITEAGSQLQKLCEEVPAEAQTVTAEALTQWLMGYGKPDEIPQVLWEAIQPAAGIFLDEVV